MIRLHERKERDPIIRPGEHGRADVPSGRMAKWQRFNRAEDLIWVTDSEGIPRALTRRQLSVYQSILRLAGTGVRVSMRELATHLALSPSSVSRAAVKLAAFGFIAYQSNRGRYGGTVWVLRTANDTLGWFQDAAKAKVREWAKAANRRVSRLISNVAPYHPGREQELYQYRSSTSTSTSTERNIRNAWAWDEVEDTLR